LAGRRLGRREHQVKEVRASVEFSPGIKRSTYLLPEVFVQRCITERERIFSSTEGKVRNKPRPPI